jgi:large subunit ribosomal protein L25
MAREISIAAEPRASRGKNESRRLRQRGLIPAIVYGAFQEPVAVAVSPKEVERILHSKTGHNTIFDVALRDGDATPAMVVDWQYDPMKDTLLHVDLKRIDLTKRITVSVPVLTQGEAKGVKQQDGLLELVTREIEIECLPDDIPGHFTVDVTELMMGQSVRAGDIAMPAEIKLVSAPENVIAHVVALRIVEEEKPAEVAPEAAATPEAGATAAEPEVIKKGKKDEEPEAEGKGKKGEAEGKGKKEPETKGKKK